LTLRAVDLLDRVLERDILRLALHFIVLFLVEDVILGIVLAGLLEFLRNDPRGLLLELGPEVPLEPPDVDLLRNCRVVDLDLLDLAYLKSHGRVRTK